TGLTRVVAPQTYARQQALENLLMSYYTSMLGLGPQLQPVFDMSVAYPYASQVSYLLPQTLPPSLSLYQGR
ncbi:MAG: hypothetical protein ABDH23_07390, partial [Endomicrobiia bacterium]